MVDQPAGPCPPARTLRRWERCRSLGAVCLPLGDPALRAGQVLVVPSWFSQAQALMVDNSLLEARPVKDEHLSSGKKLYLLSCTGTPLPCLCLFTSVIPQDGLQPEMTLLPLVLAAITDCTRELCKSWGFFH